jgi:hypothetical protein
MRTPSVDREVIGSQVSHFSTDGLPNSVMTQRPGEVGVGDVLGVDSDGGMVRDRTEDSMLIQ